MRLLETHPDWEMSAFSQYQSNVVEYLRDPSIYGEIGLLSKGFVPDDDSASIDFEYLARKESESEIGSLNLMVEADKYLKTFLTREQMLVFLERSFRFFEKFFDRVGPDVVVSDAVASLPDMVARQVALSRGIPYYTLIASRIPDRVLFYAGEYAGLEDPITEAYESLSSRELSTEEIRKADNFINAVRQREAPSAYSNAVPHLDSVVSGLVRWSRRLVGGPERNPVLRGIGVTEFPRNDFGKGNISPSPVMEAVKQGIRAFKRRSRHRRSVEMFDKANSEDRFVLFPIQQSPEASTYVLAPFFKDQMYVVETLAKSIPVGHFLYVKEHPINVGEAATERYKRLKGIPNVKYIGPNEDTLRLITDSSLVVVITSSVGWEALLLGKKIVALGTAFFNISSMVETVTDPTTLPETIARLIKDPTGDANELRRLVLATLQGTVPGKNDDPFYYPPMLSEENLDHLQAVMEQTLVLQSIDMRSN